MEDIIGPSPSLSGAAKRFFHRLLAVGENRFNLFLVEVQEERDRVIDIVLLTAAVATLGLLAMLAWTAALVVFLWQYGPVVTLLGVGAAYAIAGVVLFLKLAALRRQQDVLGATLDQLRKDRACLKEN